MLYKVEGVVVRAMDYGEGNKIISLYTREAGKMSVMARGAKKMNSRYAAVAQLFTYGQYVVYKSRMGSMGTLNAAEIVRSHQKLREEIRLAAFAAYIAEMYEKLLPELEPNPVLFEQLLAAFLALEQGKEPAILANIVEMKMLALSGYMPELNACVSCGAEQGEWAVSAVSGGLLCPRCRGKDAAAIPVAGATLKLLRLFQRVDLRSIGSIEVKPATMLQLKRCMSSLMDAYLDVRWKSRSFIEQMEKYEL